MTTTTEELKDLIRAADDGDFGGVGRAIEQLAQAELSRREEVKPKLHWSDCATSNRGTPELEGPCDCGGYVEEVKPAKCVCSIRELNAPCGNHSGADTACATIIPGIGACLHDRACHGGEK